MVYIFSKKIVFLSLATVIFAIAALFGFAHRSENVSTDARNLLIIDAGHGGQDGGASGADGTLEKELALQIALKLRDAAKASGYEVIMTREEDVSLHKSQNAATRVQKREDLDERKRILKENNGTFISIHLNKFEQTKYRGAQVFFASGSAQIGQRIQKSLITELADGNTREAKQIDPTVYILKNITTPAVIVECGFMSNPEELALLKTPEYQEKLAGAILKGLTQSPDNP